MNEGDDPQEGSPRHSPPWSPARDFSDTTPGAWCGGHVGASYGPTGYSVEVTGFSGCRSAHAPQLGGTTSGDRRPGQSPPVSATDVNARKHASLMPLVYINEMCVYVDTMRLRTTSDVGTAIRRGRHRKNWTQADLADAAGVTRVWVSKMENGKPGVELNLVLRAFAALDLELSTAPAEPSHGLVDLDSLFGGADE